MNRLFSASRSSSQFVSKAKMSINKVSHCIFDMDGLLLGKFGFCSAFGFLIDFFVLFKFVLFCRSNVLCLQLNVCFFIINFPAFSIRFSKYDIFFPYHITYI